MRKLLKNKKVFFTLILGICIGLFCAAKGLQNHYFNQQTQNVKVTAENAKKTDESSEKKSELQKNEVSSTSPEKSNTTSQQSKTDSNKITTGSSKSSPTNKSTTTNNNTVSDKKDNSPKAGSSTGADSSAIVKVSLTFEDKVSNKDLPSVELNVKSGASVGDITRNYLDSQKADYEDDGGYMAMIFGLWQKDKGNNSGWCYYVNGGKPSVGENSYVLKSGDTVVWKYLADGLNQ